MKFDFLKKCFLTSHEIDEHIFSIDNEFHVKSIELYSLLALIMLCIHSIVNLILQNYITGIVELSLIFLIFINLWILYKTRNISLAGTNLVIASIILLIMLLLTGGSYKTGIFWYYHLPIIAFFLKKKKGGFISIAIFLIINCILIILALLNYITLPYSYITLRQVLLSFIVVSILTFIYECRRERNEEIIEHQLYIDPLTKLPNRYMLIKNLSEVKKPDILLVNIDDFKELNDFYGHKIGDIFLIELSKKLKAILPEKLYIVYRLHSDEYAVLPKKVMTKDELKQLSIYLSTSITHKFFKIKSHELTINITIGIAKGRKSILENADMALKFAKKKKKNYLFYDKSMRVFKEYENNLKWIKQLKNAITANKIVPYFQPIYNIATKKIEEYECLARMISDRGEIITPNYFIDIAKKSKLCSYLTRMIVKKSVERFKNTKYRFSINISSDDILNAYTVAYIKKIIKDQNIGDRIIFELLESESIENYSEVSYFIKQMKEFGCRFAIDDFGVGYSNFQHILKLNVDYLKIDASLIMNIPFDKNAQAIVESIISFSKRLKIKTVAEFAFSKAVYNKLKSLKVDYVQGFYIGPPEPFLLHKPLFK